MSGTPLACTRLHELRNKNNSLRGSYGTSQPKVGVAAALTYFEGKSSKEKSNMIIELLQTLSMEDQDSQTPECLSTVLCSFLHARDKVSEIITSFSGDIVCCNPLDNMITALTQHAYVTLLETEREQGTDTICKTINRVYYYVRHCSARCFAACCSVVAVCCNELQYCCSGL